MPRTRQFPISVLFVSATSNKVGGGQISLLELLGALDRERFAPRAAVGGTGELADAFAALNVPVTLIDMPSLRPRNIVRYVRSIQRLARLARSERVDVIHSNDPRAHLYTGPAAWWARVPAVFHYRVSYSDGVYDRFVPMMCSKLVAVSRSVANRFRGASGKVEVIENGVDMNCFHAGAQGDGLPADVRSHAPLIGTIGRLERAKGIHDFIEAISILKKSHPGIGAVIVGRDTNGEGKQLVELCARLEVTDNVVFVDASDDIASLLAALDVYVLLSDNEGLNRSIIEAMSCETAVVATAVGGNSEVIADNDVGRLVPYEDPAAAAAAIDELVGNPELRSAMGREARNRIAARFSLARHKERMEALFASLAGG